MSELCDLHGRTGVGGTGEYLSPNEDRQVGLGMLGLSNFLRRNQLTYAEFGQALEEINSEKPITTSEDAHNIAWSLKEAIEGAAYIA